MIKDSDISPSRFKISMDKYIKSTTDKSKCNTYYLNHSTYKVKEESSLVPVWQADGEDEMF